MQSFLRGAVVQGLAVVVAVTTACGSEERRRRGNDDGDSGEAGAETGGSSAGRAPSAGAAGASAKGGSAGSTGAHGGGAGVAGNSSNAGGSGNASGGDDGGDSGAGTSGDSGEGGEGTSGAAGGEGGAESGGSANAGGSSGSSNAGSGASGGTSGSSAGGAGSGGSAGSGGCSVPIDPLSHHLGDGDGSEGTSFSRTFNVSCACEAPWLSFQMDGPNRESPPRVTLNGSELPSLLGFFPAVSAADVWQSNTNGSHDYNGYLQIHYDVSGKLVSGTNTFGISNGVAADDYNFQDVRLECGAPTTPAGPDIVTRGGWVGYFDDRTGDDPLGIQGAFYSYSDGVTCSPPSNVCASGACCLAGATLASDPDENWGCGMGLQLNNHGTELPYGGPADCFELEFTGNSGGNEVRLQAAPYADMNNRTAPVVSLGPIDGTLKRTVCLSEFACPQEPSYPCVVNGSWYKLEANVVGGSRATAFNVCLRSLIPLAL